MAGSTIEQLKAWWTPARKAARAREDRRIEEQYPEQYVAYVDDWSGEELVRTVLGTAHDLDAFYRLQAALSPKVRERAKFVDTYQVNDWSVQVGRTE